MFDQYGPNSLKVGAFIRALGSLSAAEFALNGQQQQDRLLFNNGAGMFGGDIHTNRFVDLAR